MAPISEAPCTLFWPRSGFSPVPSPPDVPGEQRQVDQRQGAGGAVRELRDAHAPVDGAALGCGVQARRLGGSARGRRRETISAYSGVNFSTEWTNSSKPSVRCVDELLG